MRDRSKTNTFRLVVEIALFVAVVTADAYGLVPITQTIFLLPLVWIMLRLSGESWKEIVFLRPDSFDWAMCIGVLAGVAMELFAVFVTTPLISGFFGREPNYSKLKEIRGNLPLLFMFLGLSWTLAALGEEICFRGFLMNRLARVFGKNRGAWLVALLLSSILFGWGTRSKAYPAGFRKV